MDQNPQFSQNQMPPPPPPSPQYQQPPVPPPQFQQQYQPQRKNPIVKIIIILFILIVLGGIASWVIGLFMAGKYFSFVTDYAKNLPQQKEQINNLTENINKNIESAMNQDQSASSQSIIWKTYKNNMFGFQFDYPSDLGDVIDFSLSYPSKEKFGEGPVIVTQGGDLSFGVTVGKECMAESFNIAEVSNIVVDGISSKKYNFSDSRAIVVCSVKGNYVYELSFAPISGEGLISQENVATFEKMVSTFRF